MKFAVVSAFLFVILVVVQGQLLVPSGNQVGQQGVNLLGAPSSPQTGQESSQDSVLLLTQNGPISQGGSGALPVPPQPQQSTDTGKGLPAGAGKSGVVTGKEAPISGKS